MTSKLQRYYTSNSGLYLESQIGAQRVCKSHEVATLESQLSAALEERDSARNQLLEAAETERYLENENKRLKALAAGIELRAEKAEKQRLEFKMRVEELGNC